MNDLNLYALASTFLERMYVASSVERTVSPRDLVSHTALTLSCLPVFFWIDSTACTYFPVVGITPFALNCLEPPSHFFFPVSFPFFAASANAAAVFAPSGVCFWFLFGAYFHSGFPVHTVFQDPHILGPRPVLGSTPVLLMVSL